MQNQKFVTLIKNLIIKNSILILLLLNSIKVEMSHEDLTNKEIIKMVIDKTCNGYEEE